MSFNIETCGTYLDPIYITGQKLNYTTGYGPINLYGHLR